ncbi:MAG: type II secretion system inner membrane protein GspF [Candidatus Sedimenticola sp. 6PFRAG7]
MAAYEYTALDEKGKKRKGIIEGDTAKHVRSQLRGQKLSPLSVTEVQESKRPRKSKHSFSLPARGLDAASLALVTRQLATLVRSGMPIESTLDVVARQSEKQSIRRVLVSVRAKVLEGHSLESGLGEFPGSFSDLYRATVGAGEKSGHLDHVLERLADHTEAQQALRQKIIMALFYPAMLTVMAVLVTVALMTYVVPEVVQVFEGIGQELPPLTVGMIATSDLLRDYGLYMLLALFAGGIAFRQLISYPGPRKNYHRMLIRLPVIGRLVKALNTAQFARTLGILTSSGVAVLEGMLISAQVVSNLPMREAVTEAAKKVREGGGLSASLDASRLFPPMTLSLIASGESSGNLGEMLERSADNHEREVESSITTVMGLFEPLLILLMGGLVLTIVLAILLPIFDLNQLVQ